MHKVENGKYVGRVNLNAEMVDCPNIEVSG